MPGTARQQAIADLQLTGRSRKFYRLPTEHESRVRFTQRTSRDQSHERSEEHTSELQSRQYLVCRLLLEKKKQHDESAAWRTRKRAARAIVETSLTQTITQQDKSGGPTVRMQRLMTSMDGGS